jgi:hypothetical protein
MATLIKLFPYLLSCLVSIILSACGGVIKADIARAVSSNIPTPKAVNFANVTPIAINTIPNPENPQNTQTVVASTVTTNQLSLPTLVPTLYPPVSVASIESMKDAKYDFLFLSNGKIERWNHTTWQIDHFVSSSHGGNTEEGQEIGCQLGKVVDFLYHPLRQRVVVVWSKKVVANGVELFCIDEFIHPFVERRRTVVDQISHPSLLSLSPDGNWLAYQLDYPEARLYLIKLETNSLPYLLGECHTDQVDACSMVSWSADSRKLAWTSGGEIWISNTREIISTSIPLTSIPVSEVNGTATELPIWFDAVEWEPGDRFLTAWIHIQGSDVRWQAVVDTRLRRGVEAPGSYGRDRAQSLAIWKSAGTLLVLRNSNSKGGYTPMLEEWSVLPARYDLLVRARIYPLVTSELPGLQELAGLEWEYHFDFFSKISDRYYAFVISTPQSGYLPVLFLYDSLFNQVHKISELPQDIKQIYWSPHAASVLLTTKRGNVYYVREDQQGLIEINDLIGSGSQTIKWIP